MPSRHLPTKTLRKARRAPHRWPARAGRVALATLLALVATGLAAGPAAAHTALEASSPGDGARLKAPPSQIKLAFTEPVRRNALMRVDVRSAEGTQYAWGNPRVAGEEVVQALTPLTESGRYEVNYQVVALDGHLVTGGLKFTVSTPADSEAVPEPDRAAPEPPLVSAKPRAADDDGSDVPPWGIGLGVLGACAVVGGAAWIGRQVTRDLD